MHHPSYLHSCLRRASLLLVPGAILLLAGCASFAPCPAPEIRAPALASAEIDSALFLIGDAGEPAPVLEPALRALTAAIAAAREELGADRVTVVFLGDNLYPAGLREPGYRGRAGLEAKLDAQLAVLAGRPGLPRFSCRATTIGAKTARMAGRGWRARPPTLPSTSQGRARLLPENGCPGPVVIDRGDRLRLIALDTHWWLRQAAVPRGEAGGCAASSEPRSSPGSRPSSAAVASATPWYSPTIPSNRAASTAGMAGRCAAWASFRRI